MVTTRSVELLTHEQVESVHESSLEILENVDVFVRNEETREHFVKHGCLVDVETQIINFPSAVVEHFCQAIPLTFTFHGRDLLYDRTIPGDGPLVITGSSAPDIIDLQTGQVRRSRSDDIARMLKQTARGLYISEENLALDAIEGISLGGICIDKVHTIERMRTTALLPEVANRLPRNQWEAKGAPDSQAQAMQRVHEILTRDNPAVLSPDENARIRTEFEGLVAEDAIAIDTTTHSL